MEHSAFVEVEFFLLVVVSLILPSGIYGYMMWKKTIPRKTVLMFGVLLIVIAGASVYLLQTLKVIAKNSTNLFDDQLFASEISLALYLLPALFAGIGVNIISHLLIKHLEQAEKKFDEEH